MKIGTKSECHYRLKKTIFLLFFSFHNLFRNILGKENHSLSMETFFRSLPTQSENLHVFLKPNMFLWTRIKQFWQPYPTFVPSREIFCSSSKKITNIVRKTSNKVFFCTRRMQFWQHCRKFFARGRTVFPPKKGKKDGNLQNLSTKTNFPKTCIWTPTKQFFQFASLLSVFFLFFDTFLNDRYLKIEPIFANLTEVVSMKVASCNV